MLDVLETKREALILIKRGCTEVKYDSSKALLIQEGISRLKILSGDDLFTKLVCAIGYEKMEKFKEAISEYDYCIGSLPNCALKYGISGMKYRALAKESIAHPNNYAKISIECYNKALKTESNNRWKKLWEDSMKETQRML